MGWEYPSTAEESWKEGYFCFLDGPTWSHNDSWYLKLAFTSKPYQKKGSLPFNYFIGQKSLIYHGYRNDVKDDWRETIEAPGMLLHARSQLSKSSKLLPTI